VCHERAEKENSIKEVKVRNGLKCHLRREHEDEKEEKTMKCESMYSCAKV
jgi:hypothetical protein